MANIIVSPYPQYEHRDFIEIELTDFGFFDSVSPTYSPGNKIFKAR